MSDEHRQDPRALATAMIERLREDGTAPGIEVGETAPTFELPGHDGTEVSLSDRLASGPVVLSFYRGAWCPVCNAELQALTESIDDIRRRGAALVAVSGQAPDASAGLVERLGLPFDVLSDVDQRVIRDYRLQFELPDELRTFYRQWGMALDEQNGDRSWSLPVPATFVIDTRGIVRSRHVDPDYRQRMSPREIVEALDEIIA